MPNRSRVGAVRVPVEPLGRGVANLLADMVGAVVRGHRIIAAYRGFDRLPREVKPQRRLRRRRPLFHNAAALPVQFTQPTVPERASQGE